MKGIVMMFSVILLMSSFASASFCDDYPNAVVCDDAESGTPTLNGWLAMDGSDIELDYSSDYSYNGAYSIRNSKPESGYNAFALPFGDFGFKYIQMDFYVEDGLNFQELGYNTFPDEQNLYFSWTDAYGYFTGQYGGYYSFAHGNADGETEYPETNVSVSPGWNRLVIIINESDGYRGVFINSILASQEYLSLSTSEIGAVYFSAYSSVNNPNYIYIDNVLVLDYMPSLGPTFCDFNFGEDVLFCDDAEIGDIDFGVWDLSYDETPYYSNEYVINDFRSIYLPAGGGSSGLGMDLEAYPGVYSISFDYYIDAGDGFNVADEQIELYIYDPSTTMSWYLPNGSHSVVIYLNSSELADSPSLYLDGVFLEGFPYCEELPCGSLDSKDLEIYAYEYDAIFDNFLIKSQTFIPCSPNWQCSQYNSCQTNNQITCYSVADLNSCGDSYTGNGSEFISSCVYSTPPQSSVALVTNSSQGPSNIQNVTDLVIAPTIVVTQTTPKIDFTGESINVTAISQPEKIIVTSNLISIDVVANPELNRPARLTMTDIGPGWNIYKDDGYNTKGTTLCPANVCTNIVYNEQLRTLSFDVTGFSTYFVGSYTKDDLKLVVVDGLGKAGASIVSLIELIVIALVLFLIVSFIAKWRK